MKYPRFFSRKPGFLGTVYKMSKSRVIGAGAGIGRANGGGGYNTGGNQGGGNKKQGLIGTTNMRVGLVPYVRTRADGGNARHWTFCMNQLGGVGRRWGQAAGPGNRGGVHAPCHALADLSRRLYPRRPPQTVGYGQPSVFRAHKRTPAVSSAPAMADMNIWVTGIGTENYNGPTLLLHPYFFYQGLVERTPDWTALRPHDAVQARRRDCGGGDGEHDDARY